MSVIEFIKNHKRQLIVGVAVIAIVIGVLIMLHVSNVSPKYKVCKDNQTGALCKGEKTCIDNCKKGESRCGDICESKCCSSGSECVADNCCEEKDVCRDINGVPTDCCKGDKICVNHQCVDCGEDKEQCRTKDPNNYACCDSKKDEKCCGESGCCKSEKCIKDDQGNEFCCDENNSVIVDGKCCRLTSIYMKDGKLTCCDANNVCFDGTKASCCSGGASDKCYDSGYCITGESSPAELKGQCIVSGGGPDISTGKFCVNRLEDAVERSSFKQCTEGGSECSATGEVCKDLFYRKPPGGCTDSSQCIGMGQQGISQKCFDVVYDDDTKSVSYKEAPCDSTKQQVHGGNCSFKCSPPDSSANEIYCPDGDACVTFKPPKDGKGPVAGPYCSKGNIKFKGGISYNPEPIAINGDQSDALNTCGQYYEVDASANTKDQVFHYTPATVEYGGVYVIKEPGNFMSVGAKDNRVGTVFKATNPNSRYNIGMAAPVKCTMYNTKSNSGWVDPTTGDWSVASVDVNPIKDPLNDKYYCPLSHTENDQYYTAVPLENSVNMRHTPVQIAGSYFGYGTGTEVPKIKAGYKGPYTVDTKKNHFKFGPGDKSELRTMSMATQEFADGVQKGDINPSDCYAHFNNAGVGYVELDESGSGNPLCRAQYNCSDPEYINSTKDVLSKIPKSQVGQLAEVKKGNDWTWGGLACYNGERPTKASIRDSNNQNLLSYYWYCDNTPTFP